MKRNIITSAISASLFIMISPAFAAAPETGPIVIEGVEGIDGKDWSDPITISESLNTHAGAARYPENNGCI
ncbi:Thiamine-phosphate pyrophosphorylase [Edwardsiella anguillarum]|uniref:hypothetical protein n=1 Tax=Edwardsiella TaxID=635 RepID=UPI00045CCF73|nr:hypothetical protein [Edwardsiella anguillarum]GAJ66290.1 thiamine-phosphate pyrophosphorylase [Edwardsiella piscicida]BET81139.1 Thiamine-phosphate pyrophosphorylase [Edwardsiella anguillarum]BET84565.1 Thiamine-phosphate pyrophosphorylase [Edwardsiella anguillarum]BET87931.1 Thiamine-phosphate pyrophosphorylase [Edwardsiella anguillarum]BET91222.1 Thiamine-phosphate pyrophosphorylase [Edwardsiella anguillarum]